MIRRLLTWLAENKFAEWLLLPEHKDDLGYILIAKEIEEIREYMADPWYYAYEGDEEHQRLNEVMKNVWNIKVNAMLTCMLCR